MLSEHWSASAKLKQKVAYLRGSFCESGEAVRELPGKSGKLLENLWFPPKFHSERTSGEVAGKPAGKSRNFPEARGSLTHSQRLAKLSPTISEQETRGSEGPGPVHC